MLRPNISHECQTPIHPLFMVFMRDPAEASSVACNIKVDGATFLLSK